MSNTLLTITQITRKALQLFRNSNAFIKSITRQYDDQFARDGAKIGTTLRIRLPNDYTVRTGPTAVAQNTTETSVTLTVASQLGVDVSFSSVERAMSLDDFGERVLDPMMNVLAGGVAADVMTGAEGIPNLVHAVDGANNTVAPTANTWLAAGAVLDQNNAPRGRRKVIMDPLTQSRTVGSLAGLFNASEKISRQYTTGMMGTALGFDFCMDQTVIRHTTGAYSTLGTVSGANQTGTAITTSALAGPLVAGDIVTFAGAVGVNRVTKASTGVLKQFVVTANVAGSATSIPIYPALTPQAAGPVNAPYQTVVSSPTNGGAIASPVNASEVYIKNFAFAPEAVTMVTADLPLPTGAVIACHRENWDGISLRAIDDYNSTSDQWLSRIDILYGWVWPRPEWACIVGDAP